jgi:hypothetical protein
MSINIHKLIYRRKTYHKLGFCSLQQRGFQECLSIISHSEEAGSISLSLHYISYCVVWALLKENKDNAQKYNK